MIFRVEMDIEVEADSQIEAEIIAEYAAMLASSTVGVVTVAVAAVTEKIWVGEPVVYDLDAEPRPSGVGDPEYGFGR